MDVVPFAKSATADEFIVKALVMVKALGIVLFADVPENIKL